MYAHIFVVTHSKGKKKRNNVEYRPREVLFHPCDEQHCSVGLWGIADPSSLSVKCREYMKRLDLCCIISSLFHSWGWLAGVELAGFSTFLAMSIQQGLVFLCLSVCLCQKCESKTEKSVKIGPDVNTFLCWFFTAVSPYFELCIALCCVLGHWRYP